MPRYFLNIRDHDTLIADPDGDDVADLGEARALALAIIRDILERPGTYGRADIWNHRSFEITDEIGNLVLTIAFSTVR